MEHGGTIAFKSKAFGAFFDVVGGLVKSGKTIIPIANKSASAGSK
jgi:hypothetical protein